MSYQIGDVVNVAVDQQAFQGDVFIDVTSLPEGATAVEPNKNGLFVFAEGESTGHVHAVKSSEADVYFANDNSATGGKRFFVVPKGESVLMFHGIPGTEGIPEGDKGDHGWLRIFKPKKKTLEVVRQRVLDLCNPSDFRQVAD